MSQALLAIIAPSNKADSSTDLLASVKPAKNEKTFFKDSNNYAEKNKTSFSAALSKAKTNNKNNYSETHNNSAANRTKSKIDDNSHSYNDRKDVSSKNKKDIFANRPQENKEWIRSKDGKEAIAAVVEGANSVNSSENVGVAVETPQNGDDMGAGGQLTVSILEDYSDVSLDENGDMGLDIIRELGTLDDYANIADKLEKGSEQLASTAVDDLSQHYSNSIDETNGELTPTTQQLLSTANAKKPDIGDNLDNTILDSVAKNVQPLAGENNEASDAVSIINDISEPIIAGGGNTENDTTTIVATPAHNSLSTQEENTPIGADELAATNSNYSTRKKIDSINNRLAEIQDDTRTVEKPEQAEKNNLNMLASRQKAAANFAAYYSGQNSSNTAAVNKENIASKIESLNSGKSENTSLSHLIGGTASSADKIGGDTGVRRPEFLQLHRATINSDSIINQIKVNIQQANHTGSSIIRVSLQPAELGSVDIKMDIGSDGKVHVNIIVEKVDTLNALQRDARALEKALAGAGLDADIGNMEFSMSKEGNDGQDIHQEADMFAGNNNKTDATLYNDVNNAVNDELSATDRNIEITEQLIGDSYQLVATEGLDIHA